MEAGAQAASEAAKQIMTEASANGPVVFIAVAFLLIFASAFGAYFWYVLRPDRDSRRKIEESNAAATALMAQTTAAMGQVVSETHEFASDGLNHTIRVALILEQFMRVHGRSIPILQKIAAKLDLGIDSDIAAMLGAMESIEHSQTQTRHKAK
jgi:hypothetical protein